MYLTVCGGRFDVDWVRERFAPHSTMSAYQVQTLDFCHRWLRGDETFELQTSGSTGTPKKITIRREQMEASARGTAAALNLTPADHALVCINTAYIGGMMMLVRALEIGMQTTVIEPTSNPFSSFTPHPSTFIALVPMQVQASLNVKAERNRLSQCRAVLIGGAPMSATLEADCVSLIDIKMWHTYGMTETVSHVALRPVGTERFVPLDSVELNVDERDCLLISCPMTRGEQIVTNDVVDLRPDGSFAWLGRIDNVINSGGVKVHAEKVERELGKVWPGKRLFVTGMADDVLGERVVAVVECHEDERCYLEAKGRTLGLGRYDRPREVLVVEKMCETESGKIDRQATLNALRRDKARLVPTQGMG